MVDTNHGRAKRLSDGIASGNKHRHVFLQVFIRARQHPRYRINKHRHRRSVFFGNMGNGFEEFHNVRLGHKVDGLPDQEKRTVISLNKMMLLPRHDTELHIGQTFIGNVDYWPMFMDGSTKPEGLLRRNRQSQTKINEGLTTAWRSTRNSKTVFCDNAGNNKFRIWHGFNLLDVQKFIQPVR